MGGCEACLRRLTTDILLLCMLIHDTAYASPHYTLNDRDDDSRTITITANYQLYKSAVPKRGRFGCVKQHPPFRRMLRGTDGEANVQSELIQGLLNS